jgi:hypothetical protein
LPWQVEIGFEIFDIVSDFLTVWAVHADANAGRQLLFAYVSFFGVAMVASLYSMSGKLKLLIYKLRKRTSKHVVFASPQARKVALLEERSDIHKMHLQKALSYILLAICEVRPLTILLLPVLVRLSFGLGRISLPSYWAVCTSFPARLRHK